MEGVKIAWGRAKVDESFAAARRDVADLAVLLEPLDLLESEGAHEPVGSRARVLVADEGDDVSQRTPPPPAAGRSTTRGPAGRRSRSGGRPAPARARPR